MTGQQRKPDATVACGSCVACCSGGQAIFLHVDEGDDPSLYETQTMPLPGLGGPSQEVYDQVAALGSDKRPMLKRKPNGDCIYLGDGSDGQKRCTIYEKRPVICRTFSCITFVTKWSKRISLTEMVEMSSPAVVQAGLDRIPKAARRKVK
jgi:Fe-S-cluster containining protein